MSSPVRLRLLAAVAVAALTAHGAPTQVRAQDAMSVEDDSSASQDAPVAEQPSFGEEPAPDPETAPQDAGVDAPSGETPPDEQAPPDQQATPQQRPGGETPDSEPLPGDLAGQDPPAADGPPPVGPTEAVSEALNPLSAIAAAALQGFRERPLFSPSRRAPQAELPPEPEPEPVDVAAPPPEPAPQPNLRLTGIVEGPDDAMAVVQDLDDNTTTQLRLGDMLNGWLVTSIDPVALRLTLGERDEEYRLFDPKRPPPPPTEMSQDALDVGRQRPSQRQPR
jgi:hypothetical protein